MKKFITIAVAAIAIFGATEAFAGPHGGGHGCGGRGGRGGNFNNNTVVVNNGGRGCWGGGGCRPCGPGWGGGCPGYAYDRGYRDGRHDSNSGLFDAACITNIVASGVSILGNLSNMNRTTVVQPVVQQPYYQQQVVQQPVYTAPVVQQPYYGY